MATYSSYKKIAEDSISDGIVQTTHIQHGARPKPTEFWVFHPRGLCCQSCANNGSCCAQSCGYCCQWTVPAKVTRATFEIWSGGGGGPGMTCCNCCSFSIGGAGGNYAVKSIAVQAGWTYTICAGGSWPCHNSHTCSAGMGCRSYVNGCNLSNFCVMGACGGWMCNGDAWGPRQFNSGCANCNICSSFGADFGISGSTGYKLGHMGCHCSGGDGSFTGIAPFIGKMVGAASTENWCQCGCYTNWPAGGGIPGTSSYCNNWAKQCGAGVGQGGSGIVRITYS